jgi:hypothetical protein
MVAILKERWNVGKIKLTIGKTGTIIHLTDPREHATKSKKWCHVSFFLTL